MKQPCLLPASFLMHIIWDKRELFTEYDLYCYFFEKEVYYIQFSYNTHALQEGLQNDRGNKLWRCGNSSR